MIILEQTKEQKDNMKDMIRMTKNRTHESFQNLLGGERNNEIKFFDIDLNISISKRKQLIENGEYGVIFFSVINSNEGLQILLEMNDLALEVNDNKEYVVFSGLRGKPRFKDRYNIGKLMT